MRLGTARCATCRSALSGDARFCPQCGSFVGRTCGRCGAALPVEAEICVACGAPEPTVAEPEATDTGARIAASAPDAVAAPVAGERKHVTMLFADTVGSTDLIGKLGAEAGRWLMEAIVDRMRTAVEAFGGIVNQVSGDGVMALFGAPRALEDHALRACHAALWMQESVRAQPFDEAQGRPVAIRVGIHSGEVVVAERGRGFDHQYTAFGLAAHTAARMEQAAQPGEVLMSPATYALVAGRVQARRLPPVSAKGIAEPVEPYLLKQAATGDAAQPRRANAASFIGRDTLLERLAGIAAATRRGEGRAVVVTGEPGSGKSRLCLELLRGAAADFRLLRTAGISFLPQPAYGGIAACLRALLPSGTTGRAGLRDWLVAEGAADATAAAAHAPALAPILTEEAGADPAWSSLSFRERQARTVAAAEHVLRRASRTAPVLLFVDDIQWVDPPTVALLGALAPRLRDAQVLILATARAGEIPDAIAEALGRADGTLIAVDSFTEAETGRFLDAVLGPAPVPAETRRRLFALTGGNAFFLEEVVRAVRLDPAAKDRAEPAYIPDTVQALLAMRIDSLSATAKSALQAASVLGMEVRPGHVARMLGLAGPRMEQVRAEVVAAAFLAPGQDEGEGPGERLAFRHALARDAAYAGLLRENRQHLHARALEVLERDEGEEAGPGPGVLAFHARECEDWPRAARYGSAAGQVSLARAAPNEALTAFTGALDALGRMPDAASTWREELPLRFLIRNTLFSLGRAREIGEHLEAARRLAEALGDKPGQARALCQLGHYTWQMGRWMDAMAVSRAAAAVAVEIGDVGLEASSAFFMGLSAHALGEFETGAALLARNVATLTGPLETERFGFVSVCSVVSGAYLAINLTELGRFEEAEEAAERARAVAHRVGNAFDKVQADLALASVALMQGDAAARIGLLEAALGMCRAAGVAVMLPRSTSALALAYALAGRAEEAEALAAEREEQSGESVRAMSLLAGAEAMLLAGRPEQAGATAARLVALARATSQVGAEGWGLLAAASADLARGAWRDAVAGAEAAGAIARSRAMRPLAARAGLVSAMAAFQDGAAAAWDGEAGARLRAAADLSREYGMGAWVRRVVDLLPPRGMPAPPELLACR
jgi:class 3 adenylate cyclase/tetratricopeptide (TPR) repeat protein